MLRVLFKVPRSENNYKADDDDDDDDCDLSDFSPDTRSMI